MGLIDLNTLATSALAFTVAFAWNDAVNETIQSACPRDKRKGARAALAYAVLATLLIIVIVVAANHATRVVTGGRRGPVAEVRWVTPAEKRRKAAHLERLERLAGPADAARA